jgi:hypothetical protein
MASYLRRLHPFGPFAVAAIALWIAAAMWSRHPTPVPLMLACGLSLPFAMGLLVRDVPRYVLALGLFGGIGALVAALVPGDLTIDYIWVYVFLVAASLVTTTIGWLIGMRSRREHPDSGVRDGIAIAIFLMCLLPVPVGLIERHRTVRESPGGTIDLDLDRGAVGSVALGSPQEAITTAFGTPQGRVSRRSPAFLPYDDVTFQVREGAVTEITVYEPPVQTADGLGLGDSISLFENEYPWLECSESMGGSDATDPYPTCRGLSPGGARVFIDGEYGKAGLPVELISIEPGPAQ